MISDENSLAKLKEMISRERKIVKEMASLFTVLERTSQEERRMVYSQLVSLKNSLKKTNEGVLKKLEKISLIKPLDSKRQIKDSQKNPIKQIITKTLPKIKLKKKIKLLELEKRTLKRLKKKKEKIIKQKIKKPSIYVKTSNKIFSNLSISFVDRKMFRSLKRDLIKASLQFTLASYISVILFTTLLSIIAGIFAFLFFLFFNFGAEIPFITKITESIGERFLKVFWILFVVPIGTFLIMYFYPSLEKKSTESRINQELPFATIHMSAISGSMIEPSKIFNIIISTKEYPYLEKEFTKLINKINIQGDDLVSALRSSAFNSPSAKLAELFNGLATTINSGGDLQRFFNKRAESLLFEYRIRREKYTRSSETFMDIYISVVIAAPMIFMLLLMMMKISGLGISISTSMISLIMILGVSLINIVFLTFLHLRQPEE